MLELETRRRIYEHVTKFPGTHMREIQRALALPVGTLEYHLHYMTKLEILVARADERYTRYFVAGAQGRREKDILSVLRQKIPRQVATHLLLNPDSTHGSILKVVGVSPSTLSFHLKKMMTAGIISRREDGRENRYTVAEADLVAKTLIVYRESFVDDVVDRFAEAWLSLEPNPPVAVAEAPETDGVPEPRDVSDTRESPTGREVH
ncbi:MAG: winged helix-turn-helix transcriptional regulator [Euryarchaeota archaeon]|nr:winged helix-turn-helix transcriptional regulator [Euryarchaeota archaeon]